MMPLWSWLRRLFISGSAMVDIAAFMGITTGIAVITSTVAGTIVVGTVAAETTVAAMTVITVGNC